jgi:hypothetical protein
MDTEAVKDQIISLESKLLEVQSLEEKLEIKNQIQLLKKIIEPQEDTLECNDDEGCLFCSS